MTDDAMQALKREVGFLRSCVRSGERLTVEDDARIEAALSAPAGLDPAKDCSCGPYSPCPLHDDTSDPTPPTPTAGLDARDLAHKFKLSEVAAVRPAFLDTEESGMDALALLRAALAEYDAWRDDPLAADDADGRAHYGGSVIGAARALVALAIVPCETETCSNCNAMFRYGEALGRGLSDAEARKEGWPRQEPYQPSRTERRRAEAIRAEMRARGEWR